MENTLENGLVVEDGVAKNGKACEGDVAIPEGVTELGAKVFYNNKKLTSLTLPEGLTAIRRSSVSGCSHLEWVYVPDSVTELEDGGLTRKFDTVVGYTHVMETVEILPVIRCHAGSWIDQTLQALQAASHVENGQGNRKEVTIEYV